MKPPGPRLPRRIAHFDLDTFFVAVERLHDRSLRDRPVLVGGHGPRGVVSSASYEARRHGCHSAQPMAQALRLCPAAAVVPAHFERYRPLSRAFHRMLAEASPAVESAGLDEAYVDLTGAGDGLQGARATAEQIRARVRRELGLAVSVCVAGSRIAAKVGSGRAKPDGLLTVPEGEDAAFLAPLPVRELPLVGPRMAARLEALGVRTIGEAAALDATWLLHRFGRAGALLSDRARGIDRTPVRSSAGRVAKSVSREVTFHHDVTDAATLRRALRRHAERVGADLRRIGRRARTVTLKLRWSDFTTLTRSRTPGPPVQTTAALAQAGHELLDELRRHERMRAVRLIGLGASNLVEDARQLGFDDLESRPREAPRDERLDRTLDTIRERFGDRAVARGA